MRYRMSCLWPRMILFTWAIIISALFAPSFVLETLPRLEGRLFPVVLPMVNVELTAIGPDETRIEADAIKVRDCPIDTVRWRRGFFNGRTIPIRVVSIGRVRDHEPGTFPVGPWILPMSIEEVRRDAHAYAMHDCHTWLPWLTESPFLAPADWTATTPKETMP